MNNLVSIIVPAKNEEGSIRQLLFEISTSIVYSNLSLDYEIIVVDDSTDKTAEFAEKFGAKVVKGKGQGLGQAIIDGIEASRGDIVVVMDADLSHDPRAVPSLIKPVLEQGYDMTVGSRYVEGGGSEGWGWWKRSNSFRACLLAMPVSRVRDASSGFFAFRKVILEGIKLEPSSQKIMLEILVKADPVAVLEVPILFRERRTGKSKGGVGVGVKYLIHLAKLYKYKLQHRRKIAEDLGDGDYEWRAFFQANFVRRMWKRKIAEKVVGIASNSGRSGDVLDFGCGSSPLVTMLNAKSYLGIDKSAAKVEFMKSKCLHSADFITGNIDTLERLKDKRFDAVLCTEVIEHLPAIEEAGLLIGLLGHKLKANGLLILATPNTTSPLWRAIEKAQRTLQPHCHTSDHQIGFTEDSLDELCLYNGLHKVVAAKIVLGADMVMAYRRRRQCVGLD